VSAHIASHQRQEPAHGQESRYDRIWTITALVAAAALISIAVLQSPRLPLLTLAFALGSIGGILFVKAPASSPAGRRQYVGGALGIAGLVLVTVGVGHHVELGLTVVAVLACTSPSVVRWIAGR
jgi:hypothetical protein